MSNITLAQQEARLAQYLAAEERILAGQSYTINGRSLTRANLKEVQDMIEALDRRIGRQRRGGLSVMSAVPE